MFISLKSSEYCDHMQWHYYFLRVLLFADRKKRGTFGKSVLFYPDSFVRRGNMFVLLSVTLCFLGYLLCLKSIYNRFNRLWQSTLDSILPPSSRLKGVNFLPTRDPRENGARADDGVRVLLVTAHPDDECMFFAPAVIKLTESNAAVYLLCLSSGRSSLKSMFGFSSCCHSNRSKSS